MLDNNHNRIVSHLYRLLVNVFKYNYLIYFIIISIDENYRFLMLYFYNDTYLLSLLLTAVFLPDTGLV